jgi:hypothetical protein
MKMMKLRIMEKMKKKTIWKTVMKEAARWRRRL